MRVPGWTTSFVHSNGNRVGVARGSEAVDGLTDLARVGGAQVLQDGASEDAKPDFDLVEP